MRDISKLRSEQSYSLMQIILPLILIVNFVHHETASISCLGPKIQDLVPKELKSISNLTAFRKIFEKWSPENCLCRLCKIYVSDVGLV